MEFRIAKRENTNLHKYPTADVKIATSFSNQLQTELKDFLKYKYS